MKAIHMSAALMLLASPLRAAQPDAAVTAIFSSSTTANGQPLVFPQSQPQVRASIYEIPSGATLPEHRHFHLRYGYVLSGKLRVTYTEIGADHLYEPGDFIIEAIGQWHKAATVGSEPVKLLVIDQAEKGQNNVEMRK
jgi:quercetin dioxygenase-like cupin family protein